MLLSVLINSNFTLVRNPNQVPGSIIIDGTSQDYGENVVTFATQCVANGRATSVSVRGDTIAEFVAALLLFGVTVKSDLLSALFVNPKKKQGRFETMRRGISSGAALVHFVQQLTAVRHVHVKVGDTASVTAVARAAVPTA